MTFNQKHLFYDFEICLSYAYLGEGEMNEKLMKMQQKTYMSEFLKLKV